MTEIEHETQRPISNSNAQIMYVLHALAPFTYWLLAVIALLASAIAHSESAETLRVGGDANYPPYHFLDDAGEADGFDVALVREVARDLGMAPRFELGAWDDALERLARGEVDIVPMFWSAEREQRYLFTEPILIRHHALFGPRSQAVLDSLDELANVRVAVQHAGLAWEALRAQAGPGVTIVELDNEAETLAAVARGDADYALAPTGIGYYAIHQHDMRDMVALSPPLLERHYVFAVRHGRADLVARIDASLERLRASGVQNDLYVEWIGNLSARRSLPWAVISGALALLLVISAGTVVALRRRTPERRSTPVAVPAGTHQALLADLQDAIDGDCLGFQLQPKLDLRSGRWVGAELLVRWNHPSRGPLEPDDFVPIAEEARVIGAMSLHLVRCGLRQCRQWPPQNPPLHVSVNISANDLADPRLVDAIIALNGEEGPGLMLEITETDVMREPELVEKAVPRLRAHGIRISVDDFGAGHSSLVNLRRLAPDELKIDRSFVTSLLGSRSDQAIITAIIGLAHELGATVAAEGIEDDATRDWLAAAGCDIGQGFGIACPMDPGQLAILLRAQA
jgi:EAL domain-containing protein (putative c-di-GMP-specific phosphodiesterase class I)/ABC-type amino acid transport substrate-binding protein